MKKYIIIMMVAVCSLLGATTIFAETLTVSSESGAPGATVTLLVTLGGNTNGVAGASFTLDYETENLTLTEIRSDFFPTFTAQSIEPEYVDIDTGSGTERYYSALVVNDTGTMLAAARINNGPTGDQTIFELDFEIADTAAPDATFDVQIIQSTITNAGAGYESPTPIPFLVGIGADGTSYPTRDVSTPTTAGTVTVSDGDTDNDGIDDQWERDNVPAGINPNSPEALDVFTATGDYDRDGYSDFVEYENDIVNGITDPTGQEFSPTITNAPGGSGYDSSTDKRIVSDFNGDGTSDILARYISTGRTYVFNMAGSAVTSSDLIATFDYDNWEIIGNGDFNGDGTSDILARYISTGRTYVFNMAGSAVTSNELIATFNFDNWEMVGIGDFNGDGTSDILARYISTGRTYVYSMQNSAVTSVDLIATFRDTWELIGMGDFNGDGTSDILARYISTGRTYVFNMQNSAVTSNDLIATFRDTWELIGMGDFNGDGTSDILARYISTGRTYVFSMQNSAVTSNDLIATFRDTWSLE